MITSTSLDIGRVGLKKLFKVESAKARDYTELILGNKFTTTQTFERFKSMQGFGLPDFVSEGENIPVDDYQNLFTAIFTPKIVGKAFKFTKLARFTDQYGFLVGAMPSLAKAFAWKGNQVASDLMNLGFVSTINGMNNETLFSASHSNGNNVGSNTGTAAALSPLAVQSAKINIMNQLSPKGDYMNASSSQELIITVPNALAGTAYALANTERVVGSNFNDASWAKPNIRYEVVPYYTSPTAYFARVADNDEHKLFWLQQMPYDIEQLPRDISLSDTYVASESYVAGWSDWHGTYGNLGA